MTAIKNMTTIRRISSVDNIRQITKVKNTHKNLIISHADNLIKKKDIKKLQNFATDSITSKIIEYGFQDDIIGIISTVFANYITNNYNIIKRRPRLILSMKLVKSLAISISAMILNNGIVVDENHHLAEQIVLNALKLVLSNM